MFKKGQSGNPKGRTHEKVLTDALRVALFDDDRKKVRKIAENIALKAADGDKWAMEFVFDRMDGKADSTLNVNQSGEITIRSAAISAVDALISEALGAGPDRTDAGTLPN